MSQYNPQTKNFIRDYMFQKRQIIEHFLFTLYRLYHTGAWTNTYRDTIREKTNKKTHYNPNVVVNLSMPNQPKPNLLQSNASMRPPLMHLNSINSQAMMRNMHQTPVRSTNRDINWNSPTYQSPQNHFQGSPFRNPNFNPIGNFNQNNYPHMPHNQRYGVHPHLGISITDGRPSDSEAMDLVNKILNAGSPIAAKAMSPPKPAAQYTPVVPEFQPPQRQAVRETVEIPSQQMASTTTFTPVNVDDIPIRPKNVQEAEHHSPEFINDVHNSTVTSIEIPKYDFEEMLKKALQEQGEDVSEPPKKKEEKKSKKPKFLKRKKRYDPREAIENEKKKKSKSKRKSAFPEGFLKEIKKQDSQSDNGEVTDEDEPKEEPKPKFEKQPSKAKPKPKPKSDDEDSQDENEDQDAEPQEEDGEKGDGKPKPFLKRKSRAVKFQKLNWKNVKGRIDCWTKKSARSEHREKSQPPANRTQHAKNDRQNKAMESARDGKNNKNKEKPSRSKATTKSKTFNNIKSRIDTGIRKTKRENYGSDESGDSFEYPNRYNLGEFANESSEAQRDNRRKYTVNPPNYPPTIDVRRFQFNRAQVEEDRPGYTRPKDNVQYEVFSSEEERDNREEEEYEYNEMHNHYVENPPLNQNSRETYNQSPYEEDNEAHGVEMDRENLEPLDIDHLEMLYKEIHPKNRNLDPCTDIDPRSIIPQITPNSIFLN